MRPCFRRWPTAARPARQRGIASALGTIGDRRAVPALCKMLPDESNFRYNQRAAAHALADIGDPSALPALRKEYSPTKARMFVASDDDYASADRASMQTIEMAIERLESLGGRPGQGSI